VRKPRFQLTPYEPGEDALHQAVADLLAWAVPDDQVVWTHFPAGGYFLSPAAKARLYRLGLKAGIPDLIFWWGCSGPYSPPVLRTLMIELKTSKGRLNKHQEAMHPKLQGIGIPVEVCRSVADVLTVLRRYGVPLRETRLAA
jgi:hypothetical protein